MFYVVEISDRRVSFASVSAFRCLNDELSDPWEAAAVDHASSDPHFAGSNLWVEVVTGKRIGNVRQS